MRDVVRSDSIEELAGHRISALELAREGLELLLQAEAAAKRAAPSQEMAGFLSKLDRKDLQRLAWNGSEAISEIMRRIRCHVDTYAWRSLQKISGLRNLMDAIAHDEFSEQIEKDPPEFNVNNAVATYFSLAAQAPEIFERSVVTVFRALDVRRYKTNSAFRLGIRIVITGFRGRRELIQDLDRVMHVLDGKKPPEGGNAADLFEKEYCAGSDTATTEYFEVRMFRGNGNLHLKFRRQDLVDAANRIIERRGGETLPDDRRNA